MGNRFSNNFPMKWKLKYNDKKNEKFGDLPLELQLRIFSYLTPFELARNVAPVCKRWWMLSKDATLWRKLKFVIISQESIPAYCKLLERCHSLYSLTIFSLVSIDGFIPSFASLGMLKVLDLSSCQGLDSNAFQTIVSCCPLIENLNLENFRDPGIDFSGICHIVTLRNLRLLNLAECDSVDDLSIKMIATKCQKLELLNIDQITELTDATVCELAEHLCETLHHLYIDGEKLTDSSILAISRCRKLFTLEISLGELCTDEALKAITTLPYLSRLKLNDHRHLSAEAFKLIFSKSSLQLLEDLEFNFLNIDDCGLQMLAHTCENLQKLKLTSCIHITDEGLRSIIENCSKLHSLVLMDMRGITGESFIQIPVKLPNLRHLGLDRYQNFTEKIVQDLGCKMPHLEIRDMCHTIFF